MDKIGFANLLFRLEELLAGVDCHRRKISDCKTCKGWKEVDYRNMCPSCLRALHEEFQGIEKLAKNDEFKTLMKTMKEAVDEDRTGELAGILALARRATEN